jgi:hypothetical protein
MVKHTCRFRMSASKCRTGYTIHMTCAFIPAKDTPQRVENHRNVLSYTYGIFAPEEIQAVVAAGKVAAARFAAASKAQGLEAHGHWAESVASMTQYLGRPLPTIDYLNFMGIQVYVPKGKGQKAVARKLYEALLLIQEVFAESMEMDIVASFT